MFKIEDIKTKIIQNLLSVSELKIKYCNGDLFGSYDISKCESCNITTDESRKEVYERLFENGFRKNNLLILEYNKNNMIKKMEIKKINNEEYYFI
jgi:hypothetical protein